MLIASLVAPALRNLDQAYQFIQEYVGFISPGVLSIFLLGFFLEKGYVQSGAYLGYSYYPAFYRAEVSAGMDGWRLSGFSVYGPYDTGVCYSDGPDDRDKPGRPEKLGTCKSGCH